tara:strand:+ start:1465 stop:3507 length:2043 start_codon:yes stop_codon:yes gene_type:complete
MEGGEAKEISWEEVLALAGIGQWSEVARHCESFVEHPVFGENAIQLQAEAYMEMGEPKVAIEKLQPLLKPGNISVLTLQLLARAQEEQGFLDKAKEVLELAVSVEQSSVGIWKQLGAIHVKQGTQADAAKCYLRVVELDSKDVEAWNSLGAAYANQSEFENALNSFSKALSINPEHYLAGVNRLFVLNRIAKFDGVSEEVDRLIEIKDGEDIRHVGALSAQQCCDWDALCHHFSALDKMTEAAITQRRCPREQAVAGASFTDDPQRNKRLTHAWAQAAWNSVSSLHVGFSHRVQIGQPRIRVGYFSSDFRLHPISQQTLPLYGLHNRERFEVFVYSTGIDDGSPMRKRIVNDCDHFVDLRQSDTLTAAQKIFDDEIDILIDFSGHTENSRMEICALRPAPVQATMLSATGTNGGDFYDYVITDPIVFPESSSIDYTETPAWLAGSFFINHREEAITRNDIKRSDYGLPEDAFVFGTFNQSYKITREAFSIWVRLLKAVPKSVLWVGAVPSIAEANLRDFAAQQQVGPDRLIFAKLENRKDDHLRRLQLLDLGLDTLVFNGQTTTKDLLWAGVPVVAYYGRHVCSRVSASLLWALGLKEELVAHTLPEYEETALTLAENPEKLLSIRKRLWSARMTSSLFDMPIMVRQMEGLYTGMVERHNSGKEHQTPLAVDGSGVIISD